MLEVRFLWREPATYAKITQTTSVQSLGFTIMIKQPESDGGNFDDAIYGKGDSADLSGNADGDAL
jgi:hypothetical protein